MNKSGEKKVTVNEARFGLKFRVLLLLLLVFCSILALLGFHVLEERGEELAHGKARVRTFAEFVRADQDAASERVRRLLDRIIERPELKRGLGTAQCSFILAEAMQREPHLANMVLVRPNGDVIGSAISTRRTVNIADRPYFQAALKTRETAVGEVLTDRVSGNWALPFCKSIRDDAGRVLGAIVALLDLPWMERTLSQSKTGQSGAVSLGLINRKGIILARYPDPDTLVGHNAADTPFFRALIAQNGKGAAEARGPDGPNQIFAFAPFAETHTGPIFLWAGISRDAVMKGVEHRFAFTLAGTIGFAIFAFWMAWLGSKRWVLRPVSALSYAAQRIAAGDLSARTGLRYARDELGGLAQRFDDMAESIESNSEIKRVNRALRVLSAGNRTLLHTTGEQNLPQEMCKAIVEAGGYRLAWVGYTDTDEEKTLRTVAMWDADKGPFEELETSWEETRDGQQSPSAKAIHQEVPIVIQNVLTDPDYGPWRELAGRYHYTSCIALPLRIDDETIGVLNIYAEEPDAFSEREVALLSESAADLSFGIAIQRVQADRTRLATSLKSSEDRFRQTLDNLIEGCMIIGFDWTYLYVNDSAAKHGRQERESLLGRTMRDVYPAMEHSEVFARYRSAMQERIPQHFESAFTFDNGLTGWFQFIVEPAPEGIFVLSIDITERKQSELALSRANRALRTLSACNEALVRAASEPELLNSLCRLIVESGGYRMAWVGFAEQDPEKTVHAAAKFGYDEGYLETAGIRWSDTDRGRGTAGIAIRTGTTQVNPNTLTNPNMAPWREAALQRGYRSSIALPLKSASGTFGALTIYAAETDAFRQSEVDLLQELADDLSFGIDTLRTRAERDQIAFQHQHHAEILRQSLEDSIQAIADTIDRRDSYTAGHQRRVGKLAVAIAKEMDLPDEKVHGIGLAAMVHDLGKIGVPAEILSKPDTLAPLELGLIKTHAQIGHDILKNVKFPWPIATIVLQHHERYDGSGYPQGLQNGDILIESRIMAVADVIEAMASHRPYRPALGIEAALSEIESGKGTTYDPAVVDACVRLFREKNAGLL